jgi:O-antigen/teichoic acid export membrane protein
MVMSVVRVIAKNTAVLFLSNLIGKLFGFLFVIYTARFLGAEGFGHLSFALALAGLFALFPDWGLNSLAIREMAREKSKAKKYLENLLLLKAALWVLTMGAIAVTVHLMGYPPEVADLIYLISLSLVFVSLASSFNSVFQAHEKMEYVAVGNVMSSLLVFLLGLAAVNLKMGIVAFGYVYVLSNLAVLFYSYLVSSLKFVRPEIDIDWCFSKAVMVSAFPFFLSAIFSVIAFRVDMVMISFMKGDMAVGWYSAAYRLLDTSMVLPSIFVVSIYPLVSRLFAASDNSLRVSYEKSFKYLITLAIPFAVGTTILAQKIISLLYPEGFENSVIALQIIVWTAPLIFSTYLFGTMMASMGQQRALTKVFFLAMVLNIGLNLILIPTYSFVGAGVATVLTELSSFLLMYRYLSLKLCKLSIAKTVITPVIASFFMAVFLISFIGHGLFILIFVSISIYFVTFIVLGGFSKDDYSLFREVVKIESHH